ncbi:MAG: hypothetical protein HPY78_03405 [Brevinematales bacterium]|nr:hypothetical protein [Brevinematales bacterium]
MKRISIIRGDREKPLVLPNGDMYDSTLILSDENEKTLFWTGNVNTDHTVGYKGGILAEGEYYAICGKRQNGTLALYLYDKRYGIVRRKEDLPDKAYYLPSLIPNPNHNGQKIMAYILIHQGGTTWDWSHGCLTILGEDWEKFIKHFRVDETALVCLKRGAFYRRL